MSDTADGSVPADDPIDWPAILVTGLVPFGAAVERIALREAGDTRDQLCSDAYNKAVDEALLELIAALSEIGNTAAAPRAFGVRMRAFPLTFEPIGFDVWQLVGPLEPELPGRAYAVHTMDDRDNGPVSEWGGCIYDATSREALYDGLRIVRDWLERRWPTADPQASISAPTRTCRIKGWTSTFYGSSPTSFPPSSSP